MIKLSDNNIIKLIWVVSATIGCLLIYFVCLPLYQHLISSGGRISGVRILILFVFTIFSLVIIPLISYAITLFFIDCLKLSQQALFRNKITGFFILISILSMILSPIFSSRKMSYTDCFFQIYHHSIFLLFFPLTVILLSRFVLHKINKYPVLLGMASMTTFYILGIMHLIKMEIPGEGGYGWLFYVLFIGIAVCLVSIVVNLLERKKLKAISGSAIK